MASFLKQMKCIKQDIKFTVFGYIRQNENNLSLFCNVPSMISYLCLSYYFHGEYFEKVANDVNVSNDKMTITKISNTNNWKNTSYGKTWIDSIIPQIVEWKFKINKMLTGASGGIFLCVVSMDDRLNEDCNEKKNIKIDYPNYGFNSNGFTSVNDSNGAHKSGEWKWYNFPSLMEKKWSNHYYEGDIMSMIINTKSRVIYFQKQGGTKVPVIENITISKDTKYKMAVSFYYNSCSVSLIDFKCDLI